MSVLTMIDLKLEPRLGWAIGHDKCHVCNDDTFGKKALEIKMEYNDPLNSEIHSVYYHLTCITGI